MTNTLYIKPIQVEGYKVEREIGNRAYSTFITYSLLIEGIWHSEKKWYGRVAKIREAIPPWMEVTSALITKIELFSIESGTIDISEDMEAWEVYNLQEINTQFDPTTEELADIVAALQDRRVELGYSCKEICIKQDRERI